MKVEQIEKFEAHIPQDQSSDSAYQSLGFYETKNMDHFTVKMNFLLLFRQSYFLGYELIGVHLKWAEPKILFHIIY